MKYVVGMCVILAILVVLSALRINYLLEKNNALETEKNGLTMELKRRNENVLAISERKKKIEQASANDKTSFDWNYRIDDSSVMHELRKQCKSCPTKTN